MHEDSEIKSLMQKKNPTSMLPYGSPAGSTFNDELEVPQR